MYKSSQRHLHYSLNDLVNIRAQNKPDEPHHSTNKMQIQNTLADYIDNVNNKYVYINSSLFEIPKD